MLNQNRVIQAYKSASRYRSQREQEADVFRQVNASLAAAHNAAPIRQVRALADNRRLWMMVSDLMRDPTNQLPDPLRAGMLSLAMTVQREMDADAPDFELLMAINNDVAAGLSGSSDS